MPRPVVVLLEVPVVVALFPKAVGALMEVLIVKAGLAEVPKVVAPIAVAAVVVTAGANVVVESNVTAVVRAKVGALKPVMVIVGKL